MADPHPLVFRRPLFWIARHGSDFQIQVWAPPTLAILNRCYADALAPEYATLAEAGKAAEALARLGSGMIGWLPQ